MITLTELETILITCLPSLASIISIITAVCTFLHSLNKLKDNEQLKTERDNLMEQNRVLMNECKKLEKMISLYIEKAVKIKYADMTEVKNDEDLQM